MIILDSPCTKICSGRVEQKQGKCIGEGRRQASYIKRETQASHGHESQGEAAGKKGRRMRTTGKKSIKVKLVFLLRFWMLTSNSLLSCPALLISQSHLPLFSARIVQTRSSSCPSLLVFQETGHSPTRLLLCLVKTFMQRNEAYRNRQAMQAPHATVKFTRPRDARHAWQVGAYPSGRSGKEDTRGRLHCENVILRSCAPRTVIVPVDCQHFQYCNDLMQ